MHAHARLSMISRRRFRPLLSDSLEPRISIHQVFVCLQFLISMGQKIDDGDLSTGQSDEIITRRSQQRPSGFGYVTASLTCSEKRKQNRCDRFSRQAADKPAFSFNERVGNAPPYVLDLPVAGPRFTIDRGNMY